MKVLGVFRDLVPARMVVSIYQETQRRDITFSIIAEGRAVSTFNNARIPVLAEGDDTLSIFGDIRETLKRQDPDVLCIGCSWPINWELAFALCAREQNIPIVVIADIWGAVERLGGFTPDHALVIDDFEAKRLEQRGIHSQVIGDIASITDTSLPEASPALERFKSLQNTFATVLLVGDELSVITELAEITADCIRREDVPDSFAIIPRLVHPKQAKDPGVKDIVEDAYAKLGSLKIDLCEGLGTDALAANCNYTICSYSTPLRVALHRGKRVLSVHGPLCKSLLKQETGFETFPLVTQGIVAPLIIPSPLNSWNWKFLEGKARIWADAASFRPALAVEKFISLARK